MAKAKTLKVTPAEGWEGKNAGALALTPEKKIEQRQNSIMVRIAELQDKETKVIRVTSKGDADLAGAIVTDIAALRAEWRLEWYGTKVNPGDIPKADEVHRNLVKRFKALDTPMSILENTFKVAANDWVQREQRRIDEEARRINEREQKKHPESTFVFQAEKVAVEGLAARDVKQFEVYWCEGEKCKCEKMFGEGTIRAIHEVQGKVQLAKAVGAGKVSPFAIEVNESFLRTETGRLFDGAEEINGEKYVFPGVRVWKGSRMDRRSS